MSKKSSLIIYFSRADENYNVGNLTVGNTEVIANYIKEICNSDMHKVERVKDYPKAYTPCTEEAKDELKKKQDQKLKIQYLIFQNMILFLLEDQFGGELILVLYLLSWKN